MTPNLLRAFAREKGSTYYQGEDYLPPSICSRDLIEIVGSYRGVLFPESFAFPLSAQACADKKRDCPRQKNQNLVSLAVAGATEGACMDLPIQLHFYLEWGILKGERSGKIFKNCAVWSFVDLHVFEDLVPLHLKRRSFGESKCLHLRAEA